MSLRKRRQTGRRFYIYIYICDKLVSDVHGNHGTKATLTSHDQKRSTQFLGGGSSYVIASTSFKPVMKSISSGLTSGVRK